MADSKSPHLWVRVVIPGAGAIGPGKIDLLRAVGDEQSISAAARQLGMSYRRAWLLLDETRKILGTDVITTHAGGADRGGASLTPAGRELISSYEQICAAANEATADVLENLVKAGKPAVKSKKRKSGNNS